MAQNGGVVLLVGAGDAIGAAVAQRFARGGYKVCIARRDAAKSQQVVDDLKKEGCDVRAFSVDARQEEDVQALFAKVEKEVGPIEVCLYNAGSNVNKPLLETTEKLFFKAWELACYGGFLVGREAARYMMERGRGTILFTGATASLRGGVGSRRIRIRKVRPPRCCTGNGSRARPEEHSRRSSADRFGGGQRSHSPAPEGPKGIDAADIPADSLAKTSSIAEAYWFAHQQTRDGWTFELDLRPSVEKW